MAYTYGKMGEGMRDSIIMTKNVVMGSIVGSMVVNMRAGGIKENNMALASIMITQSKR